MPVWEYRIVALATDYNRIKDSLNQEGQQGWELVTVIHQSITVSFDETPRWYGYFKRAVI